MLPKRPSKGVLVNVQAENVSKIKLRCSWVLIHMKMKKGMKKEEGKK